MNRSLLLSAALCCATALCAQPLWLRNTAISPDASQIAFTYSGDIYTVPTQGGRAQMLTTQGRNTMPLWSPDGKRLAFASTRRGSLDVYVMNSDGSDIVRLTTASGKEEPRGWLGNDTVLFSSSVMPSPQAAQGAFQGQVYKVAADASSRPTLFASWPMRALDVNATGQIIFQDQKGYEDPLRKHEHSSGTADIWLLDNGRYSRLTFANCQDQSPAWGPDGTYYYTSEQGDGTLNIFSNTIGGETPRQLTYFANHPVRTLSAADNGTLAFSWNGEIYTLGPSDSEPRKVEIDIIADNDFLFPKHRTSHTATSAVAVSPDGEEVAFIANGDVYVANVKYGTTKQVTATPAQERSVQFSPDGRTLVYDSERDGLWQIFTSTLNDKDEKHFAYATAISESPLYSSPDSLPAFQPSYSPDGKHIAFLENRTTLRTVDTNGKHVKTVLDGKYNYSYTDGDINYRWSPDSRWFLIDYIGSGGWNNPDIALVRTDGSQVTDLTESGYSDSNAKWALDGKAVIWTTDRNGYRSHGSWGSERDAYIMFLDGDEYDRFNLSEEELSLVKTDDKKDDDKKEDEKPEKKKTKPLAFDLENAKYRIARLTPGAMPLGDILLSPKGDKFYYLTQGELHQRDIKKGDDKVLARNIYGSIDFDSKGENIFASSGSIKKISTSGDIKNIDFAAEQEYYMPDENVYIFSHMMRQVRDKFYDPSLHGVDWEMYGREYSRFLPHIRNNADMAELMSEVLGELNASHTGARATAEQAHRPTASLGVFFDEAYDGKGLKIAEIIKRGPLDRKGVNLRPGDKIIAIEGISIAPYADYNALLDGRTGKRTRLTVERNGGKTEDIYVKPTSQGQLSQLLYRRWVERNQAVVDSLSNGRIAYIHIQGMDSPSFRTVFSELLGKYRNCEAVVVDTRYNGGGWLHNDIAQLLSGREYVRFEPRGQYIGSEPFTQWTKPSAMLVNESNYSDAHGTPYTYQTLGLGKVIGAPIPGTMTAVWWETQVNPNLLFGIPQVTSKDMEGNVLENHQLTPDIIVYNTPEDVQRGRDAQLEAAVAHLLQCLK